MQGGTNTFNSTHTVQAAALGWQKVTNTFTVSGTGNQFRRLELFNILTSLVGNDFVIDDVSLSAPLQIATSVSPVSCNQTSNGLISVYGISGLPPYSYSILAPINITNNTGVFANLPQGSYNVTVTDANNCQEIYNLYPCLRLVQT
jgi:hypothetical protein